MEVIAQCCCGLDLHQATVVACLLKRAPGHTPDQQVRTFGTTTRQLLELRDWLTAQGCTHVGMESTGVYWQPVYAILEGDFELIVGNAHHIKQVPGRKTDVRDAEWLAQLIRHGLVSKSFVPAAWQRELRDLLRYRRKVVEARTAERNRLLKLLEQANIKLASVATDVFGVSGMRMLEALLAGQQSAPQMAELAKGRLRRKIVPLTEALEGKVEEHHRFILRMQLRRLEQMERDVAELEQRIEEKLAPFREQHELLKQIPGVDWVVAAVLIAELGVEMSVFGSARRAAAWAGVAPGNHESAGKRLKEGRRQGNHFLTTMLVEAAQAAAREKGTHLRDKFYRLKARRGYKRAVVAIAHKIVVAAYHMLATGTGYAELGESYLDTRDQQRVAHNLVHRLERLGYEVQLKAKAA